MEEKVEGWWEGGFIKSLSRQRQARFTTSSSYEMIPSQDTSFASGKRIHLPCLNSNSTAVNSP